MSPDPAAAPPTDRPKYRTILLFGAPGAGKGTQGAILGRIPGFWHCSCGDVFRSIDIHSELGKIFYDYSSRGDLVPDEVTVQMWANAVHARTILGDYKPHDDLLILDGIPRTAEQAKLVAQHIDVLHVVHLHCDDKDAMIKRLRRRALKENRFDDADVKVIRRRWEVYEAETAPVLEQYPASRVSKVNSIGSPGQVLRDILDLVVPIQNRHFERDTEDEDAG